MRVKEFVKRLAAKIADVINGCPDCEKERKEFWKTFESDKPFHDIALPQQVDKLRILRAFRPETKSHLLKWHADETDRIVKVMSKSEGWKFQFDNELPFDLEIGKSFKIPSGKIHRLIKLKNEPLLLEIEMPLQKHK